MVNDKNCALIPCGHCFCTTCIKKLDTCPNCMNKFSNIQQIFL